MSTTYVHRWANAWINNWTTTSDSAVSDARIDSLYLRPQKAVIILRVKILKMPIPPPPHRRIATNRGLSIDDRFFFSRVYDITRCLLTRLLGSLPLIWRRLRKRKEWLKLKEREAGIHPSPLPLPFSDCTIILLWQPRTRLKTEVWLDVKYPNYFSLLAERKHKGTYNLSNRRRNWI